MVEKSRFHLEGLKLRSHDEVEVFNHLTGDIIPFDWDGNQHVLIDPSAEQDAAFRVIRLGKLRKKTLPDGSPMFAADGTMLT